jgi:PadR family transcriptional regulator PadR
MEQRNGGAGASSPLARFEFAPPRRFLLPAILLLLCERPGYGYSLVKDLTELGFGRVDRPSVYRALARLESDGLVVSWTGEQAAGQPRRIYALTDDGTHALRAWMGVIGDERAALDRVLRRYRATGGGDAVLAEVEGQWAALLGPDWSPVSSSSPVPTGTPGAGRGWPAGAPVDPADLPPGVGDAAACAGVTDGSPVHQGRMFRVVPDRSAVLIETRSTVGPITFGALGLTGEVEASLRSGAVCPCHTPSGRVELDVDRLRSGNTLYDAELLRRIDARRHPRVAIDVRDIRRLGAGDLYRLDGEITLHGVTRPLQGTAEVVVTGDRRLAVTGEQVIDIRDFDVVSPTVLMLRIYPDARVRLHMEAELAA